MTLDDLIRALSGLRIHIDISISSSGEAQQPVTPAPPPVVLCQACGRPASEADLCDKAECPYYHLPDFMRNVT